jgi:hypothetical protein
LGSLILTLNAGSSSLLIGDSLNVVADAVRRSQIEWIGVRHEEGAALAAGGQAKLTGRLAVCAGTIRTAAGYATSRDWDQTLKLKFKRERHR